MFQLDPTGIYLVLGITIGAAAAALLLVVLAAVDLARARRPVPATEVVWTRAA